MNREKLFRVFFPQKCPLCGRIVPLEREYCTCYKETVRISPKLCEHCGLAEEKCRCGERGIIFLPHFTAPFIYDGLIRARLHEIKFNGRKSGTNHFIVPMTERFLSDFPGAEIDALTFVPMTKKAKAERGFNQSELLASKAASRMKLPCLGLLEKESETAAQHTLSGVEREKNLVGCFSADKARTNGKVILLIDDIKTTGATLLSCCEALFEAGAKDVFCLCAATSVFDREDEIFL